MRILIVDDNISNRMILKLLLEDYEEAHTANFAIEEASDGFEAVNMCKDNTFDIVFMDIIMSKMDGIEATKIIRKTNLEIMIIAVSAVNDSDKQKEMLDAGAEDYISKPINSDIFASRLENYITLMEARGHKKKNVRTINSFTNEIYSRHTNFLIKSEDSLSEFWEFFLLNARKKNEFLSDVVRTIFAIAEKQIKLSINSSIYIEESDDAQYFTLTKIDQLPNNIVQFILKKNRPECEYKIATSKISFKLLKIYTPDNENDESILNFATPAVFEESDVIASPLEYTSQKLTVFDYIERDDLYDLEDYSTKLGSLMLVVGSGGITEEEVTDIYTYLEKLASILSTYSEIYVISTALSALSSNMDKYTDKFIENSVDLGTMCKAFSNDMSTWIQMSFYSGAPSIDFMNDTIIVNCETISGMLTMDDSNTADIEDLDDIFDF